MATRLSCYECSLGDVFRLVGETLKKVVKTENHLQVRRKVLYELGGDGHAVEQVLDYCENRFDSERLSCPLQFPLVEEPHVKDWRNYVAEQGDDPFAYLQGRLPQLCIPIRAGMSEIDAYADVIRRGNPFREIDFSGKLSLEHPAQFQFFIHEHCAGALPVLLTSDRNDFETLDRALAFRSESVAINASVNAHMIAGFTNWDRVKRYRTVWTGEQVNSIGCSWKGEMQRVAKSEKWRFYDRFILFCAQPYSSVKSEDLNLDWDEDIWLEKSTVLRLEHEFTHYLTKRIYGRMSLNLLDETICDWAGISLILGKFNARWYLQFLGLEDWPKIKQSGRVHAYRENLDDDGFDLLCALTVQAANGLEILSRDYYVKAERLRFLMSLTSLTLELMASEEREDFFLKAYQNDFVS